MTINKCLLDKYTTFVKLFYDFSIENDELMSRLDMELEKFSKAISHFTNIVVLHQAKLQCSYEEFRDEGKYLTKEFLEDFIRDISEHEYRNISRH
jgi:hypothetical protein